MRHIFKNTFAIMWRETPWLGDYYFTVNESKNGIKAGSNVLGSDPKLQDGGSSYRDSIDRSAKHTGRSSVEAGIYAGADRVNVGQWADGPELGRQTPGTAASGERIGKLGSGKEFGIFSFDSSVTRPDTEISTGN
jgi:hypothetical protein